MFLAREPTEDDEYVLATIKFDANGVVSIKPDYNKGRKAYRVESHGIGRGKSSLLPKNTAANTLFCH